MSKKTAFGLGLISLSFVVALAAHAPAAEAQVTAQASVSTNASFSRSLTLGSMGAEVTMLQNWLISKGYAIKAGATGYFGGQTQAALARYQALVGIRPAAGYFGPLTRAHINSNANVSSSVLSYFIDTVTAKAKAVTPDSEEEGLGGGVESSMLIKAYPGLVPADFAGARTLHGELSVRDGKIVFTGNNPSNASVLTREGMQTVLNNVGARLNVSVKTKPDVDLLLKRIGS